MAQERLHAVAAALAVEEPVRANRPGQGLVFGCGVGRFRRLRGALGEIGSWAAAAAVVVLGLVLMVLVFVGPLLYLA